MPIPSFLQEASAYFHKNKLSDIDDSVELTMLLQTLVKIRDKKFITTTRTQQHQSTIDYTKTSVEFFSHPHPRSGVVEVMKAVNFRTIFSWPGCDNLIDAVTEHFFQLRGCSEGFLCVEMPVIDVNRLVQMDFKVVKVLDFFAQIYHFCQCICSFDIFCAVFDAVSRAFDDDRFESHCHACIVWNLWPKTPKAFEMCGIDQDPLEAKHFADKVHDFIVQRRKIVSYPQLKVSTLLICRKYRFFVCSLRL